MRRQLKFRAYPTESNRDKRIIEDWQDTDIMTSYGFNGGDSYNVVQFTGTYDAAGIPIYESDIVLYSKWNTADGMSPMGINGWKRGEVMFDKGKFIVKGNETWDTLNYINLQVIGNIYENPDLL